MKNQTSLIPAFIPVILMIMILSCEKDKDNGKDNNLLAAMEGTTASNLYDDLFKQVNNAAKYLDETLSGSKNPDFSNDCPTITISSLDTIFPKTITLDFGETNCTGSDLRQRRGIVQAQLSNWYRKEGCIVDITVTNYHVNDYKIEGTKTITNEGKNEDGKLTYSVEVLDGVVTSPDGDRTTWNSVRTNVWQEGEQTILNPLDDVYMITGSASGTSSSQQPYTITITDSLKIQIGCRWIMAGSIDMEIGSGLTISIDYGEGGCDPNAIATILGVEVPFVMN